MSGAVTYRDNESADEVANIRWACVFMLVYIRINQ